MKCFLINLDRNADRLYRVSRQLQSANVAFERVSAVDGNALSSTERRSAVSYFRWWCVSGCLPSPGEIGCALSHQLVYKKIIADHLPCACVFEDDVLLGPLKTRESLVEVENAMDTGKPQLVLLSCHVGKIKGVGLVRVNNAAYAEAYVITRPAAELILKANTPINCASDNWGRWAKNNGLELYYYLPTVATQDWREGFKSDVRDDSRKLIHKGLAWYSKRALGKVIDGVAVKLGW